MPFGLGPSGVDRDDTLANELYQACDASVSPRIHAKAFFPGRPGPPYGQRMWLPGGVRRPPQSSSLALPFGDCPQALTRAFRSRPPLPSAPPQVGELEKTIAASHARIGAIEGLLGGRRASRAAGASEVDALRKAFADTKAEFRARLVRPKSGP